MLGTALFTVAASVGLAIARPANYARSAAAPAPKANETLQYPPYTYKAPDPKLPVSQSIPVKFPNETIRPWEPVVRDHPKVEADLETALCSSLTATNPSTFWYESINDNGISPFIANGASWEVFRNVKTASGAAGDGVNDDTSALQNAILAGNSAANRAAHAFGTTGQPAVVYLPAGTSLISSPLQLYVGTVLMGDPINPPTIKATADFNGDYIIYAKDPNLGDTVNLYVAMKHLIIDSTNVLGTTTLTLLDWSVSQATQLTDIEFHMPNWSTGHTGLAMPEGGSGTIMNDLKFNGGATGIYMSNQQYNLKNIQFTSNTIGINVNGCFQCTFQDLTLADNQIAIQYTAGGLGALILLDSTASNIETFAAIDAETTGANSIVIENFVAGSGVTNTVTASGTTIVTGSISETWVYGNSYTPGGSSAGAHQQGTTYSSGRPAALINSAGKYYTVAPPTYQQYDVSEAVNVKSVAGYPVYGDGATDNTENLNYIISA